MKIAIVITALLLSTGAAAQQYQPCGYFQPCGSVFKPLNQIVNEEAERRRAERQADYAAEAFAREQRQLDHERRQLDNAERVRW